MSASINTIPASFYVSDIPSVIAAGGTGVAMIELMLTTNTRVPVNSVVSFPSLAAVQSYFGATSLEATEAAVYFGGFDGSTIKPGALLFTQYPTGNVGAYLRGGNISSLTLAQLQALTGVLTVVIDGTSHTSSSINLSAATSFSSAAGIITTALGVVGATQASVTGHAGAEFQASYGLLSGANILTVISVASGTIFVGDTVSDAGSAGHIPVGTTILAQLTGTTGGAGTYLLSSTVSTVNINQTVDTSSNYIVVSAVGSGTIHVGNQITGTSIASGTFITSQVSGTAGGVGTYLATLQNDVGSETLLAIQPVVSYDTQTGAFVVVSNSTGTGSTISFGSGTIAASLLLTQATGAQTSQGAAASVPASFMANILNINSNWATFQTLFDPDNGVGNQVKQQFAAWVNTTNDRYVYLCTDTDITPTQLTDATTCLGQILKTLNSSGTAIQWQPASGANHLSAFVGGAIASIDFDQTNGRATLDYKSQTGITPSVSNVTAAANLIANGYNYYGITANGGSTWRFLDPGQISGPFEWIDSYVDQIWLNGQCVDALMTLLTTLRSIPYNAVGYNYIRQTLTGGANAPVQLPPASPVAAALNNGVIRAGVPLSAEQAIAVNALAGQTIDGVLSTQGWYLVIQPATAQVRAARQSPTIILLYTDGQSIQRINLSSVLVQ